MRFIKNGGKKLLVIALFSVLLTSFGAQAEDAPEKVIEKTIHMVLEEFVSQRDVLTADKKKLYALVDELASPLFDFSYVSKLVLAKSWKSASESQRNEFAREFRKLLIITYATALFQYTGNEKMNFVGTDLKERKGVLFAKSEI